MCDFCNLRLFVMKKVYMKPLLAPITHAEELRQELTNITGMDYFEILNKYCPMCGRKVVK